MSDHSEATPEAESRPVYWLDIVQDETLGTIAAIRDGGPDGKILSTATDREVAGDV